MIKLLIYSMLFTTSIYSFQVGSIDGNEINFSNYQGRKMLIVNIATGSQFANQLTELEQLYQLHKDSLVVIAFPSNSFNNEVHSNQELVSLLRDSYHLSFPIATKSDITGENANVVYKWLADANQNGLMSNVVRGDFQKYFIGKAGNITGIFRGEVSPLDDKIKKAIQANF